MPRRRKSIRPLRAISGSAAPKAAWRNTSYWDAMVDGWIRHATAAAVFTCCFFLEPARSIWDEARYRVPGGAAWPVPGRERVLLGQAAPAEMPGLCRRSCGE